MKADRNEQTMQDFAHATTAHVPTIAAKIRALRLLQKQAGMQTLRTQNSILRALSPEVLTAVAEELAKDSAVVQALGGARVRI